MITIASRHLGRRLRAGYVAVLVIIAAGVIAAGFSVMRILGVTAEHQRVIGIAARQSSVSQHALLSSNAFVLDHSQRAKRELDTTLAGWAGDQTSIEKLLRGFCTNADLLCQEFFALEGERLMLEWWLNTRGVVPGDVRTDASAARDGDFDAYEHAANEWSARLAIRLADDTLRQQRTLFFWIILLALSAGAVMAAVLEPTIRRLQRERSSMDEWTTDREKLAMVAERTHHSVFIIDPYGRIEWANESFLESCAYSLSLAAGKPIVDLLYEINGCSLDTRAKILLQLAHGEGFRVEVLRQRHDGRPYWGSIDCRPVVEKGAVVAYFGIESDITERKLSEEQVIEQKAMLAARALHAAKEEAEAASAAKGYVLAHLSHDIRAPLNGVIGMTGLLLDTELTPEQREFAEIARSSGESLLLMINDVLDLSKIDDRCPVRVAVDFDVRALVNEIIDSFSLKAADKGLELLSDVQPSCPRRVRSDAGRLRQVLTNLTGNAVKFTADGDVSLIVRHGYTDEGKLELSFTVSDSGIGMSPEALGALFKPFRHADARSSGHRGGPALGLAITRRLVRSLGGDIAVDSVPGRGSAFHFSIEVDRAPESPDAASRPVNDLRDRHLLLVDDNAVNRQLAEHLLMKMGIAVSHVSNGLEALERLQTMRYDAVLMDCQMPVMDGYEATRRIRLERNGVIDSRVPIIGLTGHALSGDRERCLAAGMDAYMTKPIDPIELGETIRRVLTRAAVAGAGPVLRCD